MRTGSAAGCRHSFPHSSFFIHHGGVAVYTVTQLVAEISNVLAVYRDVHVEGEVSNLTRASSGHHYFTLKDKGAQLSIVMFQMSARMLRFRIENGQKLILRGRVAVYQQRGQLQMIADAAEPAGVGALQLAFEQLKQKLAAEGLFDDSRKKAIPRLPQRIAVVTSRSGAAIRDILHVLRRRFDGIAIDIYDVRVQGATAAREIATALRNLSKWQMHDVVLICRGGGSIEDLWPFNEEIVARAIAACPIPTISGVGHEVDFTIADFVADLRAPTPSAAAEIVIRAKADLCQQVDDAVRRMRLILDRRTRWYRSELRHLSSADRLFSFPIHLRNRRAGLQRSRVALYRILEGEARRLRHRLQSCREPLLRLPARLALRDRKRFVTSLQPRMAHAMKVRLEHDRKKLQGKVGTLEAVSPLSVLARGYAIALHWRGRRKVPLFDSSSVRIGEQIEVQLRKGRIAATVDGQTTGLESLIPKLLIDRDPSGD